MRLRLALFACCFPAVLSGQRLATARNVSVESLATPGTGPSKASATEANAIRAIQPPVIDGRDDDPVWAHAQVIDGFRQTDPVEGSDPRFRTEAKVAYDERNLYVFIRAFDPHPDSIIARLGRRDSMNGSDDVMLFVDGYHDKRTAYGFFVNPAGVKFDEYVYYDNNEDGSWDGVWDVATRIDSLGWTAEYRIPLSQIRYTNAADHTFGVAIGRQIARYNELDAWPQYRRTKPGLVSQFGDLTGIVGIASPHRLEVSPYSVAKTNNQFVGDRYAQKSSATAGADVKYGITSNLTLDATINPDFGQVEADPSVLNLSGFETFFPEKRPFFLEGQGIFRFDVNCNDGQCSGLFYSRRIGRAPQLGGTYPDSGNPTATPIIGAAKLTGQLANAVSVGVLDATTAHETTPGGQTVEPSTNYFVGTAGRELSNGASGVSGMLTAVDRNLDSWSSPYLRNSAYTGGLQFHHQFWQRNYEVNGYVAASQVNGSAESIASTQQDMVHDYQRPDGRVTYDSTRTALSGTSANILFNKRGGDFTRFTFGYQYISPGFEINDVGFLRQANSQNQFSWIQFQGNTPKWFYRNTRFNINQWSGWTADGMPTGFGGNVNAHVTLNNLWSLHWGQNYNVGEYCDICMRGGPAIRQSNNVSGWFEADGDDRRWLVPMVSGNWWRGDGGRSSMDEISPMVHVRMTSRFDANLGIDFQRNINDGQWNGNFGDILSDTTHYTVAHLDQKTLSLTARINYTITPNLSLQEYAQPFVSVGRYSNWRELNDPRAADYDSRFKAYNGGDPGAFNFRQFRSNTVLRWEYRPGSVLYLVWTQQRSQELDGVDATPFDASGDYRALFAQHPGNVLLIKGSYWLNF